MNTTNQSEMNRGMRSVMNVFAISLFTAYVTAYFLTRLMPLYIAFFIPILVVYFVAPKLNKRFSTPSVDNSYKYGRWIGLGGGLAVGVAGIVYALGPVLNAVNTGAVGDGSGIALSAISVVANAMYLVTFLVGYFRSK
ncbi:MAG: hypothetical protein Q7R54_00910 [bacterium]|nr:hypothetical protein [bacterium]